MQCGETRLTVDDASQNDHFGSAIAVDGDTAVVGAPDRRSMPGGPRTGGVYVLERDGMDWREGQILLASDGSAGDEFGARVDLDGPRLLVGAPGNGGLGANSGAAYVFERSTGQWIESAKLLPSDGGPGVAFGSAVAIDGRFAVVGAPGRLIDPAIPGAIYVYEDSSGGWQEVAKVLPEDWDPLGRFGFSVAIEGEWIAVGALGANNNFKGAAYVFERSGQSWRQRRKFVAFDGKPNDGFGWSVDLAPRADSVVVGAPFHGGLGHLDTDAGAAYLFARQGASWALARELVGTQGYQQRLMGISVDLEGDVVALGSLDTFDPVGVWIFRRLPDGSWPAVQDELVVGGSAAQYFGQPAALREDTLAVGAIGDDLAAPDAGSVWFFDWAEIGTRYCCPAAVNSTGEPGRIRVRGSARVADDDLQLLTADLPPGNVGYFLAGEASATVQPPGSSGVLCLAGGGTRRLLPPTLDTDQHAGGFDARVGTQAVPGLGAIVPGRTWNFQAWYRDNAAGTSNFTDAISVPFE